MSGLYSVVDNQNTHNPSGWRFQVLKLVFSLSEIKIEFKKSSGGKYILNLE